MKNLNKVIIFEELKYRYLFILIYYYVTGSTIYYIRATTKFRKSKLFKLFYKKRIINIINLNQIVTSCFGMNADDAFDNINIKYKLFSNNKFIKKAEKLYGDTKIELAFKKIINEKLAKIYYINKMLFELGTKFKKAECLIIPSNGTERFRTTGDEAYVYKISKKTFNNTTLKYKDLNNINFPKWATWIAFINYYRELFYIYLKNILFINWLIYKYSLSLFTNKKKKNKNFKYGIMIVDQGSQFNNKIQKVDFLIDNKNIYKKEVVFICYNKMKKAYSKYMHENKLYFIDNLYKRNNSKTIKKILSYSLFPFTQNIPFLPLIDTYFKLLVVYLTWDSFAEENKIDNLITFSDWGVKSVGRNIILKNNNNTKTWYYEHSIGSRLLYYSREHKGMNLRFTAFGFLFYDYWITWSDLQKEYYKTHLHEINAFINVGCLWAENTMNLTKNVKDNDILLSIKKNINTRQKKIISVFDTTLGNDLIQSSDEGEDFLKGMQALVKDISNSVMFFKPKMSQKSMGRFSPQIVDLYKKLSDHPRCYVFPKHVNPSELISVSDLVIALPFTTPSFEALCARKKAIYYDAHDKYNGAVFDKIPELVMHNYEELVKRVNTLLFNTKDEEYEEYLEKHIKNKLEPFLDGKAITRFKRLLAEEDLEKVLTCKKHNTNISI